MRSSVSDRHSADHSRMGSRYFVRHLRCKYSWKIRLCRLIRSVTDADKARYSNFRPSPRQEYVIEKSDKLDDLFDEQCSRANLLGSGCILSQSVGWRSAATIDYII